MHKLLPLFLVLALVLVGVGGFLLGSRVDQGQVAAEPAGTGATDGSDQPPQPPSAVPATTRRPAPPQPRHKRKRLILPPTQLELGPPPPREFQPENAFLEGQSLEIRGQPVRFHPGGRLENADGSPGTWKREGDGLVLQTTAGAQPVRARIAGDSLSLEDPESR